MTLRSIRARLLGLLLGATLMTWGGAAAMTYRGAHRQVDELLDAQLAQSARLLLQQAARAAPAPHADDDHDDDEVDDGSEDDGDDALAPPSLLDDAPLERRVHFQVWDSRGLLRYRSAAPTPTVPLSEAEEGFSEPDVNGTPWRVFTLQDHRRALKVQVGQEHSVRAELVLGLVTRSVAPVLAGLLVTLLVMGWAVRRALMPLQAVASEVAARTPDNLAPLSPQPVPEEVEPLRRALDGLMARAKNRVEAEHHFTANAAHELRTPLAAIRTHAQVAQLSSADAERAHAMAQVVHGVDRATRLVDQLLTLARLEPGRPLQTSLKVDLHTVAGAVLGEMAADALAHGAELELAGDTQVPVQGDAELLGTLLRNLVENAIRHSPQAGLVRVVLSRSGDGAVLEVRDSGPGIPVEEREHVFERFRRGKGVTGPGSGVGLAMVRRIAELHHARVTLHDGANGTGLRVVVTFAGHPPFPSPSPP
jgi:two-component system sensor histidine kinase QseC